MFKIQFWFGGRVSEWRGCGEPLFKTEEAARTRIRALREQSHSYVQFRVEPVYALMSAFLTCFSLITMKTHLLAPGSPCGLCFLHWRSVRTSVISLLLVTVPWFQQLELCKRASPQIAP